MDKEPARLCCLPLQRKPVPFCGLYADIINILCVQHDCQRNEQRVVETCHNQVDEQHADGIDFTPGVKIQSILEFLHKTLACESAIFMYKPETKGQRSPILRAFWQFEICRRFDTERPSVK